MAVTFLPELAFLYTGHEHWLKASDESKPLAEKAAYLLNKFCAGADPKWMILAMFGSQYGQILASGAARSVQLTREQKAAEAAAAAAKKKDQATG